MQSVRHEITIPEAVAITGRSRRAVTYAVRTGKLSSRKLPGCTGAYLLDLDEVRKYAEIIGTKK